MNETLINDIDKYEYLVHEKLDLMTEGQLSKLYNDLDKRVKQDSYNTFVDYNIQDTNLIGKIDQKLNFIQVALTIAHIARSNPSDIFGTVKPWDNMVYAHLDNDGVVIPINKIQESESYIGGYVKDPHIGRSNWVVSVDLTSLYPSIIMMLGMSPEKLKFKCKRGVEDIINAMITMSYDTSIAHEKNYTISANGTMYEKGEMGIIPRLMKFLFDKRKEVKNRMKDVQRELEHLKELGEDIGKIKYFDELYARLDAEQYAYKILANSKSK